MCEVKSQTNTTAAALNRSEHHVQMSGRELFDHSLMLASPSETQKDLEAQRAQTLKGQGVNCIVFMITLPKH